jgi:hypothetical protein
METRSVDRLISEITDRFAALAEVDLTTLTGLEVLEHVQATQRLRSLADAACVRAAGALDASKAWAPEGAKSPAAWMQWRCGIQRARAVVFLRCARELRDMPATETALLAGEITTDHVRLLVDAKQLAPEVFAEHEPKLVRLARTLRVTQFEKVMAYWKQLADPDHVEDAAQDAFDRREAHASTTLDDTVVVDALLDPVGGAVFLRELERLEQELFEADWADARTRCGDAACEADLRRTRKQRRADAMRIMAERSAAKPPGAVEARVLLQVLVGEETLGRICELSNGRVTTPGQLVPHLDKADVERIVFDGPSKVIDVGVRRRLFSGATRTAVLVRDRGCTHPSCDTPMDRCQVDHVIPWADGGLTVQTNGEGKCRFHNILKGRQPPPDA